MSAARSPGQSPGQRLWGWHQLGPDWSERLVADAAIRPGDLVLDLGAGTGALTEPLRRRGARVLAVELHPGRAEQLRERYADVPRHGPGSVAVVERDIFALRWPDRPFHVVANPPWAAAVTLLRLLTGPRSRLRSARLVLPAGLVQQAEHRGRGIGPGFWARDRGVVPRGAFTPAPPSAAAVLELGRGGGREPLTSRASTRRGGGSRAGTGARRDSAPPPPRRR